MFDDAHPCAKIGCEGIAPYDDEPYCYKHSPDSGSEVAGYSYKKSHMRYAFFAKYRNPVTDEMFWVCIAPNAKQADIDFLSQHFTVSEDNILKTRVVELD